MNTATARRAVAPAMPDLAPSSTSTAPALDPLSLRRALGSFGTGVTVISTVAAHGQLVGVTANSFGSVSLDPPIVQWSLSRNSPSLAAFDHCGRFVVNVLALDQAPLSQRFSRPAASHWADKFEGLAYQRNAHGLPVLAGCSATFECSVEQRLEVGDHVLFLGRVDAFEHHRRLGLLYCQGRYAQGMHIEVAP